MITYLAWYTLILTTLSNLLVIFGEDKPLKRFLTAILSIPVPIFAFIYLFVK